MDDYIKRKDAVDWFMGFIHLGEDNIPADTVVGDLKYAIPAADTDVEPVRHGTIVTSSENGKCKRYFSCCGADCTAMTQWMWPKYCPNCGAKMDGGAEDG